jgi:hypothetical protein
VRRLVLLPALVLAIVAATGAAADAAVPVRQTGIVLNVLAERHVLRLVEGPRVVDIPFHGDLPTGVIPGARITFTMPAKRATHIAVAGHADHVSVPGFVVHAGRTLALRLADGSTLVLTHVGNLKLGQLAHVVVRFRASGSTAAPLQPTTTPSTKTTSTTPGSTTPGSRCAKSDCSLDTIGSVTAIDGSGDLTILPVAGGAALVLGPGQLSTDNVYVGDFVHVVGTQDETTGAYTLTSLDELVGCDNATCTVSLHALVDEIDPSTVIVEDQSGDEFQIDATDAQLAPLQVNDIVDIVGTQDPLTGAYTATTIVDDGQSLRLAALCDDRVDRQRAGRTARVEAREHVARQRVARRVGEARLDLPAAVVELGRVDERLARDLPARRAEQLVQPPARVRRAHVRIRAVPARLGPAPDQHGEEVSRLPELERLELPLGEAEPGRPGPHAAQRLRDLVERREVPGAECEHDDIEGVVGKRVRRVERVERDAELDPAAERALREHVRRFTERDGCAVAGIGRVDRGHAARGAHRVGQHGGRVALPAADLEDARARGDLPVAYQCHAEPRLACLHGGVVRRARHQRCELLGRAHRSGLAVAASRSAPITPARSPSAGGTR